MSREPFFMQWHLTDACNLACTHCYRDTPKPDLAAPELLAILDQFVAFLGRRWLPGRLHLSGGEPLLQPDRLLALLASARERGIATRVLTNGTLLTAHLAHDLAQLGCQACQISLEGPPEVHEQLRGEGSFALALEGARNARQAGMSVTLSVPVARWNRQHLPALAEIARRHFDRLFVHRFVPWGRGAGLRDGLLSADEWRGVARWCLRVSQGKQGPRIPRRDPTFVRFASARARAVLPSIGGCAIGYHGFAVEANGDVYPCRRLPLVIGNLLTDGLESVWVSEVLGKLRDRDALEGRCGACALRWQCGGCRAIAHAVAGSPLAEDPQCPG